MGRQHSKRSSMKDGFSQLFNTVSDSIMLFDSDTRQFIDVNDATLQLYGYSKEEFLKPTKEEKVSEDNKPSDSEGKDSDKK